MKLTIYIVAVLCSLFPTKTLSIKPLVSASMRIGKKNQNLEKHAILATTSIQPTQPSLVKQLGPILASAFTVAALMYPLDLIRALKMANSNSQVRLSTAELLSNFRQAHGLVGFFTQGLVPELAKSTWMRFVKFSLFPIVHQKMHGISERAGNGFTRATAALLASVPEAISIMPLEIAKISLQLDSTNRFGNNMFNAMGDVLKTRGISGFSMGYVGLQYRQGG